MPTCALFSNGAVTGKVLGLSRAGLFIRRFSSSSTIDSTIVLPAYWVSILTLFVR